MTPLYTDRRDGGRALARRLSHYAHHPDAIVLGLPRGGLVVAYEIAQSLRLPLDVLVVRKLGLPGHEELAMGAIVSGGITVLNDEVVEPLGIEPAVIQAVVRRESAELSRREQAYRGARSPIDVHGRVVILVDDGLATGSTMRAAVAGLKSAGPARIIVAGPVGARETCAQFKDEVDEVVCAATPEPFYGVGMWYEDFSQTTDQEVKDLLERAWRGEPARA